MNREVHVRFCESLWVKLPRATRLRGRELIAPSYSILRAKRGTVYKVDYTPTTGGPKVTNHKWVTESELLPNKST
jgi:hypothetical protein